MTAAILQNGYAQFNAWQDSSGVARNNIIGFAYTAFRYGNDNYPAISDNVEYACGTNITYTPKFASSKLMVVSVDQTRMQTAGGMNYRIKRDGTYVGINPTYYSEDMYYKSDAVNHHINLRSRVIVPANNTNATTFSAWMISHGWGAGEFSNGWGDHAIYVWEIAQ